MAGDASREDRFTREGAPPEGRASAGRRGQATGESGHGWYWLFLVPFFGVFFPWIYNTGSPELFGMPFFYWYQMAWVPLSVLITVFVYRQTRGTA